MKLTKRETLFIQSYFNAIKKYMNASPTKKNLIKYGYYSGRIYEILFRKYDSNKLDEFNAFINETFNTEILKWFYEENEKFIKKDKEILIEK